MFIAHFTYVRLNAENGQTKPFELAISLPGMPTSTMKKEYNKANNTDESNLM